MMTRNKRADEHINYYAGVSKCFYLRATRNIKNSLMTKRV